MSNKEALFMYSLSKSFDELGISIEGAKKNPKKPELQMEVNFRLGTCLHWLMDCWERIKKNETKKNEINDSDKSYFSALACANNELKHNAELVQISKRTGQCSFPIRFPLAIEEVAFRWIEKNQPSEPKWENQRVNYQKILRSNEVLSTISKAIEIIQKYMEQIESEVTP